MKVTKLCILIDGLLYTKEIKENCFFDVPNWSFLPGDVTVQPCSWTCCSFRSRYTWFSPISADKKGLCCPFLNLRSFTFYFLQDQFAVIRFLLAMKGVGVHSGWSVRRLLTAALPLLFGNRPSFAGISFQKKIAFIGFFSTCWVVFPLLSKDFWFFFSYLFVTHW